MGAFNYLQKPADPMALSSMLRQVGNFASEERHRVLVVEDDDAQRKALLDLIGPVDVDATAVASGAEAIEQLKTGKYQCMVLDLGLPDMNGFELLQKIKRSPEGKKLPIIVYTGRELSRKEESQLRRLAETIIVKDVKSPERLLDEVSLYLHRRYDAIPEQQRRMLERLHQSVPVLAGKTILVVDDDVRNIFAISAALERYKANVLFAENGKDGLAILEQNPVDAVLMDIMMPEMDGYEVMQRIRADGRWEKLPIIAVTAKAMRADREKCIMAGASDYIAKPVDMAQLLSLLRIRLAN
jgi:CheY-like chemotaxis protein